MNLDMANSLAIRGPICGDEDFALATDSIKALAHPLRIKIMCALGNEEACILAITKSVGTTQSNISKHLVILRNHGLLMTRRQAHKLLYRLADPRLMNMIEIICQTQPGLYYY